MKKLSYRFCAMLLVLCIALSVSAPVFAAIDASEQISSYGMDVSRMGDGQLCIFFTITGTGRMTCIGADSIEIYKKTGNIWLYQTSYDRDDDDMSKTNAYTHGKELYYDGISGQQYRVIITVFAENSEGSDSRSATFDITA